MLCVFCLHHLLQAEYTSQQRFNEYQFFKEQLMTVISTALQQAWFRLGAFL